MKLSMSRFSIILFIFIGSSLVQVRSNVFVSNCNDPPINIHVFQPDPFHSYCDHVCTPNGAPIVTDAEIHVCSRAGICLCHQACYNTVPPPALPSLDGNQYCPPVNDPEDPTMTNADYTTACIAECPNACPGGNSGIICGDDRTIYMGDIYFAKVCTCNCPAQQCATPVPITTSTQTPTSMAIVLIKPSILTVYSKLVKKKLLLFLQKAYLFCWIFVKVFVLKVILLWCWKIAIGHYIKSDDLEEIMSEIVWILEKL